MMGKNKRCRKVFLGLAIGLLSPGVLFAATPVKNDTRVTYEARPSGVFDVSIGTEVMSGDTTYSIGGTYTAADGSSDEFHFPISELKWPLDIFLARVDAGLNIGDSWRIKGTLKKNISDPDDNMIDKDWITDSNPSQLDIYSDSNISDFDALIVDVDVEWKFLQGKTWSLYAGLGYQYQNFDYTGKLIHQYSPSGYSGLEFYGDGRDAITYEMTYKMPYFLIGTDFHITSNFSMSGSFSYSPWVDAKDEDHHLLRVPVKVSEGDLDGDAILVDVSVIYDLSPFWFLEGGVCYTKINVDGTQTQTSAGISQKIDMESESTQTSGYLTVGYRF